MDAVSVSILIVAVGFGALAAAIARDADLPTWAVLAVALWIAFVAVALGPTMLGG